MLTHKEGCRSAALPSAYFQVYKVYFQKVSRASRRLSILMKSIVASQLLHDALYEYESIIALQNGQLGKN